MWLEMLYARLIATFSNAMEIRMGSPYRCADLELQGEWVPELPDADWLNLIAESDNGRYLALVAWDIADDNDPGFRLFVIDKKEKAVRQSGRIQGCCRTLEVTDSGVTFDTFAGFSMDDLCIRNQD